MSNNSRKKHTAEFKGKVALAACQEKESLGELSKKYEVHPHMISNWKQALKEHCGQVFSSPGKKVSLFSLYRSNLANKKLAMASDNITHQFI